ncbi:MAG: tyrosine--tRNA ligase, partial [Spirochaetes bacterium]|nr:tyrosine--tRNA ligase [Spirochaetota bacterium]
MDSFARTAEDVVSLEEFRALLASGRKLKIKFGADVTAGSLHIGHAVNLWMMREMQERGHMVQFLVGDFTTGIGDPTGRDGARVPPTRKEIERDAEAFLRQVGRVLITDDPELFEARRNSEWWDKMPLGDFLGLLGATNVGRLLSRDMFRGRMDAGREIRTHELVYPVLQGWDSVALGSDLTIVGSDQLFNESMGRFFQERSGRKPQVIVTTRITPGLDGVRKQSKTLGNFIGMDDGPREMFGKAMSLPDALIVPWLEVYTTVPTGRIGELKAALGDGMNPRDAKAELARAIVGRWHGEGAAVAEAAWFDGTFSRGDFPDDAPVAELAPGGTGALDLCASLDPGSSRSELRRLIENGAVTLDGRPLERADERIHADPARERRLRIGRKRFFRI